MRIEQYIIDRSKYKLVYYIYDPSEIDKYVIRNIFENKLYSLEIGAIEVKGKKYCLAPNNLECRIVAYLIEDNKFEHEQIVHIKKTIRYRLETEK